MKRRVVDCGAIEMEYVLKPIYMFAAHWDILNREWLEHMITV